MSPLRRAAALAAIAVACTAPDAAAAFTASTITSPADGAVIGPVAFDGTINPFTVTGTTNGPGSDPIILRCYYTDRDGTEFSDSVVGASFTTNPDGTFSTSLADANTVSTRPCLLRAVPDGAAPTGAAALPFQPVRITA